MHPFEYLSVLISIILGLAITQLLKGIRGILLAGDRARLYWPALIWALILFLIAVQSWWAMFGLRGVQQWTFGSFAIVLLQTVVLYLVAGLVLPDLFREDSLDLRLHYYGHHRLFFGLIVLLVVTSLTKDLLITGRLPNAPNLLFHIAFAAAATGAAATARDWYHRALAPVLLLAFSAYVVTLFGHLT